MKASHASADQRLERRVALLAGQLFIVELFSEELAFKTIGIVLNFSNSGMAVQTFRPLVERCVAEIRLSIPKVSSSFVAEGLVVWEKQGGLVGIRFLNAPLKNLPELRKLVLRSFPPLDSGSSLPLFTYRSDSCTNEFETALHLFACSAMALTGATGAAIALGNANSLECCASVGNAPDVGARVHLDSGLSGHSLRTGAVNLCDDAWTDARVITAAAQQMGARSIVIVPITQAENVVGLLEAFSEDTDHFNERHVQQLLPIVNVLAEVPRLELGPEETEASAGDATIAVEDPTPGKAKPRSARRFRAIAIAVGVVAALLFFIVAIALFTIWVRTKSPWRTESSINTQSDTRQSSANFIERSVKPNAKLEIGFDPPVIIQKVGVTFGVDVVLKGAKDLLSVPVEILYDPEKLELITVTNGGMLDRDGQAAAMVQRASPADGRINVSLSRPLSATGISGDGIVFTLKFLSKTAGRSRLRFNQTCLRDKSVKILSVELSEATVDISRSASSCKTTSDQIG